MINQVQQLGMEICGWYQAPFFLISGNVFSNLIYYSHIFPIVISFLFGLLIFLSDRTKLINRTLFFLTTSFSLWALIDLILWATEKVSYIMFLWSALAIIEPLIYLSCLYLVYLYLFKKDMPFRSKIILTLFFVPIFIFAGTNFNLKGFDFTNCHREAIEGVLWNYIYAFELAIAFIIIILGIQSYKRNLEKNIKKQNMLLVIGSVLFLFTLSFGNITGSFSFDWSIAQYGLFGMPIFIAVLSYLVIRYQGFNTKIFAVQLLSSTLSVLILSLLLVTDLRLIQIITGFTFVLSLIFGYFLNLSVNKEVKMRHQFEDLAKSLQNTNHNLNIANEKLKTLDKLKTEFLSLASHQLRSPLTSIKGYASMLDEGSYGKLSEQQVGAVQRIYSSAQGLVSIVEDLLNVSKIEQGGMKYELSAIDLQKIVLSLVDEMRIPAENKKLILRSAVPSYDKFMVSADALKIKQVFLNLVDNSIKYTPSGFVEVGLYRDNAQHVVFYVKDSGVGVTEETKKSLFHKFARGEAGKLNTGGSGLGLYLAQQIVAAHKGEIFIESDGENKGATFSVSLPAIGAHVTPFTMPT